METKLMSLVSWLCLVAASAAFGHGGLGHSHKPIKDAQAKEIAMGVVTDLTAQKKIDETWKTRQPVLAQKKFGDQLEWVATFENPVVKDTSKKKLFVFLSLTGEVLGANHTGN